MKKTTHILALALVLVMALGLLPITAGAVTVTEIVPPKYEKVGNFHDGLAWVATNGKWDYMAGKTIYDEWGFIDTTGKEVVPLGKYDRVKDFSEGLAAVSVFDEESEGYKWGFIDTTGKEVVPCKYTNYDVPEFHEGLAAVELDRKWGVIDTTGKEVVPCALEYRRVGNFHEGLAAVYTNYPWKHGFIDKTGREVIPSTLEYDYVGDFDQGLAVVNIGGRINIGVIQGGEWGIIDATGKEVVPCKYTNSKAPVFHEGLAAVKLNDKWGFIDKTGKEIVPCKYTNYDIPEFHEGLAVVEGNTGEISNGKTVYAPGVIDAQGNVVVPFGKYDEIKQFSDGLAAVCVGKYSDDMWGFIDKTGKEVVPCKYDSAASFDQGLAAVEGDSGEKDTWGRPDYKRGFIDKTGKEVTPYKYNYVGNFSEGLAAVEWDYGWGFIDKTGREVVPSKYSSFHTPIPVFRDGLAVVKTDNGWGCIDLHGNEVVPCQYGEVKLLSAGMVAVKLDGKWGVLRVEGLPTEPKPAPAPTPTPEPTTPTAYTAKATNDKLTVDGVSKAPTAYKINNANYFQLRDVAVLLNSTKAQFSVEYDNTAKAIKITTGQPYQPNGKEMKGAKATAEAIVGNNDVYINGVKTDFAVYKIGGSNFFQIRDLGKALGFNVDWAKDVGIIIDPSKPYSGK